MMDHHVESEETSNDTNMISELLKSAEVIQPTNLVTVNSEKSDQQREQGIQSKQIINEIEKQFVIPQSSSAIIEPNSSNNTPNINQGFSNVFEDSNKMLHLRHVNIPYILNGELYQIQTQDGENVTVKCCHCPPDRVYRGSVRSTGNFHMHIKRRHPDLLEKLHNMKVNALLERRDRLMRNRKVSSRTTIHRNRQGCSVTLSSFMASGASAPTMDALKDESKLCLASSLDKPLPITSSPKKCGFLHTHKLKIKEVFERHQMQQKEAAEMRNWNNAQADDGDEPINYSLKSQEKDKISPLQEHQEQSKSNLPTHTDVNYANCSETRQLLTVNENVSKENLYNRQQYSIRDISTSSTSSQSSKSSNSIMSAYSLQQHNSNQSAHVINSLETIPTQLKHLHEQQGLSVIKPENLLIAGAEQQAMDLTMHTDSGVYTNCNETINNTLHNISTNTHNANGQRAGSRSGYTPDMAERCGSGSKDALASAWQDLLHHVETSLRDIQHELSIRNQIESNRIFLDIAKFKFLHPGFQFSL